MGAWGGTHALEVRVLERSSDRDVDDDGATTTLLLRMSCCFCCCCCFACCFSTAAEAEVDAAPLRAAGDELDGAAARTTREGREKESTALRHLSFLRSTRLALPSCCRCDPDPDVDATIGARKTSAADDIAIQKKERESEVREKALLFSRFFSFS